MTSPAITKSPDNQKTKSPTHSAAPAGAERPASRAESASTADAPPPSDPFSWLRIFKLADLMMKQGC